MTSVQSLHCNLTITFTTLSSHYTHNMTSLSPINDLSMTESVIPPLIPHNDQLNVLHSDTRMTAYYLLLLHACGLLFFLVLCIFLMRVRRRRCLCFMFSPIQVYSHRFNPFDIFLVLQVAILILLLSLYSIQIFPAIYLDTIHLVLIILSAFVFSLPEPSPPPVQDNHILNHLQHTPTPAPAG